MKDVKLRYKGSFLGFLWSLVNPLLMMLVYWLVFVVLLPTSVDPNCSEIVPVGANGQAVQLAQACKINHHFTAFILIGILAWNMTGGSIMAGMNSILNNSSIAKKVYFPREVLPIAAVLAQFVNFLLALVPLFAILLLNGLIPTAYALFLPVIFFFQILFLVGLALILSVVVMSFRDLLVIMEVLLQAWFFLSPVFYTMGQVYKDWAQVIYWLNPVASFIETYRALLFFNYTPGLDFTLRTFATSVLVFAIGYAFFMWKRKQIGELL